MVTSTRMLSFCVIIVINYIIKYCYNFNFLKKSHQCLLQHKHAHDCKITILERREALFLIGWDYDHLTK
jgi:hypothetical protein